MDEARNRRLHELLRRLGQAVHGSVVRSDEVRGCLEELGEQGWRAVMLVETAVACDEKGELETAAGTLRVHVNVDQDGPAYRIDAADTHLLASLGIAPGRHRANGASSRRTAAEREVDGVA